MPDPVFQPEEVIALHQAEGHALTNVLYYLWLNTFDEERPFRFLYFLEMTFDDGQSILLTSGEDSASIRLSTAEALVQTAADLRDLHGKVTIMRSRAGILPVWQDVLGKKLEAIRVSKNENGEYLADAIVLDFGPENLILVSLDPIGDGLRVDVFED